MVTIGNEFKTLASQDGNCTVDVGEYAGIYKIRFRVGGVERGTIDDNGLFTIDHIECRGVIKAATFKKDTISVIGGSVLIRPGDTLSSDMTVSDSSTLTIEGNDTFIVGDILRIKDGVDDEWLTVTNIASAPTYSVTRDREGMYAVDNNPNWGKGSAVVNYGTSGKGGILLTSSLANAPYMSIFTHAGTPWTTINERGRFGNLNGYLGYSSDTYGIGIGSSGSGEANLTFDPVEGIRIRQGTTDILTFDMAGNSKISDFDIDPVDGIYVGSGVTRIQLDPGTGFHCGSTLWAHAPFRVNQAGEMWAENANISGTITATTGEIGGWTIASNMLSIPGLELDAGQNRIRAYDGSNYVDITAAGLTGYDSVLGSTFKLLTDGSAPEFSSGIIKECVYEIYTSGVIRTGADVIANGGLIINNTDLKGYTSAGLKVLQFIYDGTDQGDAYFGDYNSGNAGIFYDHSATTLNIRGTVIFQSASGYANISDKPTGLGGINSTEGAKLTGIATGADVTGSNTANNASNYTGTSISTTYTAAKCTDAAADQTSTHTAANASAYTGANISTTYTSAKCTEANADQTSTHTADNTSNVGTLPVATVEGWSHSTTTIDGGKIYTDTVTATQLNGAGFGTLTITSGKLAINTTDALEIQASGNIKILSGGDIDLHSASGTSSMLSFHAQYRSFHFVTTYAQGYLNIYPDTAGEGYLWFGRTVSATQAFNSIRFRSKNKTQLYSELTAEGIVLGCNSIYHTFNDTEYKPSNHKGIDIGTATRAFDDVYADDFQNVADFYHFDIHDDLKAINGIKGSGVVDERTGNELIDDDTLPVWLISKHKRDYGKAKKGDIIYDEDGNPYLGIKACISLAWGAIRQLDKKLEGIKGEI